MDGDNSMFLPNLKFKYTYEMTLSLARLGEAFSDEDRTILEQGIAAYNERSTYMSNPKRLLLEEVGTNYIKVKLFSSQALATPGRGLRTLTSILLQAPSHCFRNRVTPGGQLFRVLDVQQPVSETAIDPTSVSDLELVIAMMRCLFDKRDGPTVSQKKAIEEMKKMAVEVGIL